MTFKELIEKLYEIKSLFSKILATSRDQEKNPSRVLLGNKNGIQDNREVIKQSSLAIDFISNILNQFDQISGNHSMNDINVNDLISIQHNIKDVENILNSIQNKLPHIDYSITSKVPDSLINLKNISSVNVIHYDAKNVNEKTDDLKLPNSFSEHLLYFNKKITVKNNRLFNDIPVPERYLKEWLDLCNESVNRMAKNHNNIDLEVEYLEKIMYEKIYFDLFDEKGNVKNEINKILLNRKVSINELINSYKSFLGEILSDYIPIHNQHAFDKIKNKQTKINFEPEIRTEVMKVGQNHSLANINSSKELYDIIMKLERVPYGSHERESKQMHKNIIKNDFRKVLIDGGYLKNDVLLISNTKRFINNMIDKYGFTDKEVYAEFQKFNKNNNNKYTTALNELFSNENNDVIHRHTNSLEPYETAINHIKVFLNEHSKLKAAGLDEIRKIIAYYDKTPVENKNAYHTWLQIKNIARTRNQNKGLGSLLFRKSEVQQCYDFITSYKLAKENKEPKKENEGLKEIYYAIKFIEKNHKGYFSPTGLNDIKKELKKISPENLSLIGVERVIEKILKDNSNNLSPFVAECYHHIKNICITNRSYVESENIPLPEKNLNYKIHIVEKFLNSKDVSKDFSKKIHDIFYGTDCLSTKIFNITIEINNLNKSEKYINEIKKIPDFLVSENKKITGMEFIIPELENKMPWLTNTK